MADLSPLSLDELNDRIAIVRDNIRQLIEQAAASSGAGDEARNADRLAAQQAELDALTKEREAREKKK
jgi:BRCT domain type II-containing protein